MASNSLRTGSWRASLTPAIRFCWRLSALCAQHWACALVMWCNIAYAWSRQVSRNVVHKSHPNTHPGHFCSTKIRMYWVCRHHLRETFWDYFYRNLLQGLAMISEEYFSVGACMQGRYVKNTRRTFLLHGILCISHFTSQHVNLQAFNTWIVWATLASLSICALISEEMSAEY